MTSDKDDPLVYCRHRTCRFKRTCKKSKFLKCPFDNVCGTWGDARFRHSKGPKLLPSDGKPVKRKRKSTPTRKVTYIFLLYSHMFFEKPKVDNVPSTSVSS